MVTRIQLTPHKPSASAHCRNAGGAAASEWVKHQVAGTAAGGDDVFHHGQWLFAGVFAGVVLDRLAYPSVGVPVAAVHIEGAAHGGGGTVQASIHLSFNVVVASV